MSDSFWNFFLTNLWGFCWCRLLDHGSLPKLKNKLCGIQSLADVVVGSLVRCSKSRSKRSSSWCLIVRRGVQLTVTLSWNILIATHLVTTISFLLTTQLPTLSTIILSLDWTSDIEQKTLNRNVFIDWCKFWSICKSLLESICDSCDLNKIVFHELI